MKGVVRNMKKGTKSGIWASELIRSGLISESEASMFQSHSYIEGIAGGQKFHMASIERGKSESEKYGHSSIAQHNGHPAFGGSGIAAGCVRGYVRAGAQVVFCDVNDEGGKTTETEANAQKDVTGKATYFHCDITKKENRNSLYFWYNPWEVLCPDNGSRQNRSLWIRDRLR